MARAEIFWNLIANKYSKQPIADEEAYQLKLKKTQEYFTPESSVLEFGCGTGSTALTHAPFVKNIVAIDYSKKMIDIAKDKAQKQGIDNVEFMKSTLIDHPSQGQSYDVILGLNILHLLVNSKECIERSFDLLKPGGIFVTSTVCLAEGSKLQALILPIVSAFRVIPYLKIFDQSILEKSMTDAGFKILESSAPGKEKIAVFMIAQKPE